MNCKKRKDRRTSKSSLEHLWKKIKKILQDKDIPQNLKKKIFDQCILTTLTYGCQTWKMTKGNIRLIRTAQRKMERRMLNIKQSDRIRCSDIREQTKVIDVIRYITKQKAKWAGHIAKMDNNRWTKITTDWTPRDRKRSKGRPQRRWRDDIEECFGNTWSRTAKERPVWRKQTEGYIQQWMDIA